MDFMCLALDKQHPCGKIFLNGFVFNITCNEGYNLNGLDEPPVYTLYINGTWTPRIPDCKSAYCVYSEGDNGVESPQSFHVAVGKKYFYRSPNTRTIHVREVSKHPQFFGDDTNYAVDIALMDLETSVSSIPACVGWSHEFHKTPGLIGTAAAWTSSSYRIQNVEYTYLDYASCVSEVKTSHRRYITLDKFCVQQITWESEASYGHGGGLMFQHNDVYYIQGIASTRVDNARTYGYTIRTFVNFSDVTMLQWFRQTIRSFDEVHQHI